MQNTVTVVVWLAKLANELKEASEDKKMTFKELLGLSDNLYDLKDVVPAISKVNDELKEATPEQQQIVLDEVAKNLDINSDKAEEIVLAALNLGMGIIKLIDAIK